MLGGGGGALWANSALYQGFASNYIYPTYIFHVMLTNLVHIEQNFIYKWYNLWWQICIREFLYCTVRGFTTCRQCDSLQLFTSPRRVWQEYGQISIGRLGLSSVRSLTYRILINQLTFIKHLTNKSINYFTLLWTDWTHEPGKLLLTTKWLEALTQTGHIFIQGNSLICQQTAGSDGV